MKCSSSNWEDVRKYYEGTYVKLKETGEQVWYVNAVTSEGISFYSLDKEVACYKFSEGECYIEYALPHKTTFQSGEAAYHLTRIPARMWKKGLSEKNTAFKVLTSKGWHSAGNSMQLYNAFVNKPSYISYKDALQGIKEGNIISAALSPRMAISKNKKLYVDTKHIGRVFVSKKQVVLTTPLFFSEVSELFPSYKVLYACT